MINAYFGLVWCIAVLAVALSLTGDAATPEKWWVGIGIVVFLSACAVHRSARLFALTTIVTLAAPFYLMETYLALGFGRPDSKTEAVRRLREDGIRAYPPVFPSGLIAYYRASGQTATVEVDGADVLPLSGLPNSPTVYCMGSHGMVGYVSDRLGFRNPAGSYDDARLGLAVLGDSFAQGYCVRDEATYAARLSELGPALSFGVNSSSVLVQYAIYREFVRDRHPAQIVWLFFEGNDLEGFALERDFPPIDAYMAPGYSQNLEALGFKVTAALAKMIDASLSSLFVRTMAHDPTDPAPTFQSTVRSIIALKRTRGIIDIGLERWGRFVRGREILERRARSRVALWATHREAMVTLWRRVMADQRGHGGSVTFVYIPDLMRFMPPRDADPHAALEREIRRSWDALGADHLSLTELLDADDDPARLIEGIHFSEDGYRATAAYIAGHLERRRAERPLAVSAPDPR